jgi:glycosyltransferase involved in cell wall biosynthesis
VRPEISVVIPSYARPVETLRAVRSALRQGDVDHEVIVVDDASPDPLRIPEALRRHGNLRLVRLTANGGAAAARNAGVAAAAGDYVAFLDSDDFFLPNTLAQRLAFLRAQPSKRPVFATSAVWRWDPGRRAVLSQPAPSSALTELASGCWYFPGSTGLFSKETWALVGPLNPALRRLEDLDWGIRLARSGGEVIVAPFPGAVVQRSPSAGSRHVRAAVALIENQFAPGNSNEIPPSAHRRLRAYLALERAHCLRGEGVYGRFLAEMLHSFLLRPRLSVHLGTWWAEREADPGELEQIETTARELTQPDRDEHLFSSVPESPKP